MAETTRPDLIFMDIRMPVMDGFEATRRLKQNPRTNDIPVIVLTATVERLKKSDSEKHGFAGFLLKPLSRKTLFAQLSRYFKIAKKVEPEAVAGKTPAIPPAPETIERLPELAEVLQGEIIPAMETLKGVLDMGAVEDFAARLADLAENHKARTLIDHAQRLREAAEAFDVTNVKRGLKELPGVVEKIILS